MRCDYVVAVCDNVAAITGECVAAFLVHNIRTQINRKILKTKPTRQFARDDSRM